MKIINEMRKEDDLYYQGAFWICGNSVDDIKKNNFTLICKKLLSNYNGEYKENITSKSSLTHKRLWPELNPMSDNIDWNYYPRGRVAIYNGVAYIHLNSLFNQPSIIDAIINEYKLDKLEIELDFNDTYQGSHYDFKLVEFLVKIKIKW